MRMWLSLICLSFLIANPASAQVLSGPATAIDGRTLEMTGTPIRLAFIDAPELGQFCERDGAMWACGAEAKASLAQIIGSQSITCDAIRTDQSEVMHAVCTAGPFEIGREMVRRGLAVPLKNAPPEYEQATQIATRMTFGLWQSEFDLPSVWRTANPQSVLSFAPDPMPDEPSAPSRAISTSEQRYINAMGCAIKGNHSRRGDFIYHLPGQRYYDATRPEQVFCTENEARAAGYRRSKE